MRTRLCSPRKGCHEPFDANDVAPAPSGTDHVEELVQVCCLAIVFVTEERKLTLSGSVSVPEMPSIPMQSLQSSLA